MKRDLNFMHRVAITESMPGGTLMGALRVSGPAANSLITRPCNRWNSRLLANGYRKRSRC